MIFRIRVDVYHHLDDDLKKLISSQVEEEQYERLEQLIKKIQEKLDARPKT